MDISGHVYIIVSALIKMVEMRWVYTIHTHEVYQSIFQHGSGFQNKIPFIWRNLDYKEMLCSCIFSWLSFLYVFATQEVFWCTLFVTRREEHGENVMMLITSRQGQWLSCWWESIQVLACDSIFLRNTPVSSTSGLGSGKTRFSFCKDARLPGCDAILSF